MKSLPPKTDRVKTFLDEFLIKLATMQREDSREERAILETHPLRGREILCSIPCVPDEVSQIASDHHEAMDGTGFPRNKRPSKILPLARLIAVANRFAHLTLTGAESEGLEPKKAYAKLLSSEGTLDMQFVHAMKCLIK